MKIRLIPAICLILIFFSACNPTTIATATATSTAIPTNTSTQVPTSTFTPTLTLTPTPTEVLTPQEQLERDYGELIPLDEKCVMYEELISNMDIYPPGIVFALLKLHATGNIKEVTVPWGEEKTPREVTTLQVVCRDDNGNITKPMWLVLGGKDFGQNHDGKVVYWYTTEEGANGREIITVQEFLNNVTKGLLLEVSVPVEVSSTHVRDRFWEEAPGYSNELTNQAIRTFLETKEQLKLIIDGSGPTQDDFILYPLMINRVPFPKP